MKFAVIDGNGNQCGPYIGGTAQEYLSDQVDWFNEDMDDFGWWPPSTTETFCISGGIILDTWWVGASFQKADVGDTEEATQTLRLHYVFPDKSTKDYEFGVVDYTQTKVDANNWKLEASQP